MGEGRAPRSERVDVRRLHLRMPFQIANPIVLVVDGDEQDIALGFRIERHIEREEQGESKEGTYHTSAGKRPPCRELSRNRRSTAQRSGFPSLTLLHGVLLSAPFFFSLMFSPRFSLSLAACLISSFTASSTFADSAANGIAAVVNGKVIVKSEYQDALQAQRQMIMMTHRDDLAGGQKALAEAETKALDSLIDRELILAEFAKAGGAIKPQYIDDDINTLVREQFKGNRDQFVIELAKSGMTMKKFRELREKMIIVQVMRGRHAGKQAPPTPRQVEEYYHKHEDKYRDKDMIKFSTISIAKFATDAGATPESQKKLAEEIRSKIIAGNDFAAMAKTYSADSKASDGGDWGWMERKDMKPLMGDAAFAIKNGGVSEVISDDAAYIIIYVDTKKLGTVTPLDKVRTDIEKALTNEEAKGDLDTWLQTLRKAAVIRKFE